MVEFATGATVGAIENAVALGSGDVISDSKVGTCVGTSCESTELALHAMSASVPTSSVRRNFREASCCRSISNSD